MKMNLVLAMLTVMAAAVPVSAGNQKGQISLSPVIGGYTYDNSQVRAATANITYGVRAGYNFTKSLGLEGSFDYVDSDAANSSGNIDMFRFGGELLYHFFPDKAFVPYLAAGYGALKFDEKGNDGKLQGVFDYGAGLKYFLNDRFALRADLRHLLYSSNGRLVNNIEYTMGAYIPLYVVKPAAKPVEPPPPAVPETVTPEQQSTTNFRMDSKETVPGRPQITGLNVDDNVIELLLSERIRDYSVFTLTDPSRLVVDIPNAVSGFRQKTFPVNKLGVATVRFENHPGYLRVFLDASQWRILPYRVEEGEKSLKIIITTP